MSHEDKITLQTVQDLINPILSQSLKAAMQRTGVANTLSNWLSDPSIFESEAALDLAKHQAKFLLPK